MPDIKISALPTTTTPGNNDVLPIESGGTTFGTKASDVLKLGTPKLVPGADGKAHVASPLIKDDVAGVELDDDTIVAKYADALAHVIHSFSMVTARYYAIRALVTAVDATGATCAEFTVEAGYNVTAGVVAERHKTIMEKGAASGGVVTLTINALAVDLAVQGTANWTWQIHFHTQTAIPI